MPGRKRKIVSVQVGNMTTAKRERKQYEESLIRHDSDELEDIPWDLFTDETALNEYKRVLRNLKELKFTGNLDRGNLIGYCNAFSEYVRATNAMKAPDFEPVVSSGHGLKANPFYQIQQTALREMEQTGRALGMSISDRLKLAEGKAKQEEDELESMFGAI